MRKLVKPISIMLAIVYLLITPISAFAEIGTSAGSDNALLSKWKGYGVLDKGITAKDLNEPVQKLDLIMYINSILKASKQVDIGFNDVPKNSWYSEEIAKAVACGYVVNEDNANFYPFSNITRLDAAIMVAHVFGLELSDKKVLNRITDAGNVDAEKLADFGAVIEKGYLSEVSTGRYAPSGVLKLNDAIKMLDLCVGQLVAKEGTITNTTAKNILINTSGATLKDMELAGDVIIGEGVSEGTVRLENVTIKGKLIIRGGGPNSVTLKNTTVVGNLVIEKSAGNVNVVALGTSTIEHTSLKSGGSLAEINLTSGKGFVDITAGKAVVDNQIANLDGDFNNIQYENSNIKIKLKGKAEKVAFSKDTNSSFSLLSGAVKNITTKASKNTIELLGGTVASLIVEEEARGNKIYINGTTTISNMSINENTTINFDKGTVEKLVLEATSEGSYLSLKKEAYLKSLIASAASTITGLGKIDSAYVYANNVNIDIKPSSTHVATGVIASINGLDINPSLSNVAISVPNKTINVKVGETKNANTTVSPSGSTVTYISSDNSIATVSDKGDVTGVDLGSTKVHVTGQYPSYNTKVEAIEVNVTSNNVTASGTLAVSPPSGEAGKNLPQIVLTYTPVDDMSNGTVVFKLPGGFSAYNTDTVIIGTEAEKALDSSQLPNSQTLSFTNLDLNHTQSIIVKLNNKIVPQGGPYTFTAISDADGTGPKLPSSGDDGKAVFTSDSLRRLLLEDNYSTPEPGSAGGTTKISKLSTAGFMGSTKWVIKVQTDAFTEPKFDDVLAVSTTEFTEYKQGQDISASANQHLIVAAVDDANKVKAYAAIIIAKEMIRPYDAGQLKLGSKNVVPGIQANAVRINDLASINVDGADHWMYRVQETALSTVFVDTVFAGTPYVAGDDIKVNVGQHIILVAVDKDNKIKAYADIQVEDIMISKEAVKLQAGTNFSIPTLGSDLGTTKLQNLNKGNLDKDDKWMIVLLSKDAVAAVPSLNTSTADFVKYTEGNTFTEYVQNIDIIASAKQQLLLVDVKTDSTRGDLIQAYVYLTIEPNQIRGTSAPEIPKGNIGTLEMGSKEFTTRISSLSLTGSAILVDTEKFMIKVQNEAIAAPQLDSIPNGYSDYTAKSDIKPESTNQIIVLVATDKAGRVKAYMNIAVDGNKIRPANAIQLKSSYEYQFVPGIDTNSTSIVALPVGGVSGSVAWEYKIQNTAFEVPYKGSILGGTTYKTGDEIKNVYVNQHVLLVAVDGDGKTIAYADEVLNTNEVKQPTAKELKPESPTTPIGYNYSVPVPGIDGGTTRIITLNNWDLNAESWYYSVSGTKITAPAYDSGIPADFSVYNSGKSVDAKDKQYFILLAVKNGLVKAYANIPLTTDNISLPVLKSPTNYTISAGSAAGTTKVSNLAFTNLVGANSNWKWMYAVGNGAFAVPVQNTDVNSLSYKSGLTTLSNVTTTAAISIITPNPYIMLLAVDENDVIQGYANIKVDAINIKPADAPVITGSVLEKGSVEGTTRFSNLTAISGATQWMIYVQQSGDKIGIDTAPVTAAQKYDYSLNPKPNISVNVNDHIILLAVDSSTPRKVKAYADITVTLDLIQTPFAKNLPNTTDNYTGPRKGTSEGTTNFTLLGTNVPDKGTETIVWKYKTGTQELTVPHYNDNDTSYTACDINGDFAVQPNNWLLVVATIGDKVKAYFQLQIGSSSIKPKEAPPLAAKNYKAPTAGSNPGTTKMGGLDPIDLLGFAGWKVNVFSTPQTFMLGNSFTGQWSGTATDSIIDNIKVNKGEYVVLAAVNSSGIVIAYKCIQITDASQISALGFDNNYSGPEMGSVKGTTRFDVSKNGLDGADHFVAKVVGSKQSLTTGEKITLGSGTLNDYGNYRVYTALADISVKAGEIVVLIAVDSNENVLAYANIEIPVGKINSGNAVELQLSKNYILETGTSAGTVKFTYLNKFAVPDFDGAKWIVQFANSPITPPILNTTVTNAPATGYTLSSNIDVKPGKYLVLYAVDSANAIKGYACIQVRPEDLDINPMPVPGTDYLTTKIAAAQVTVPPSTILKYVIQNSSAGVILLNSTIPGLQVFPFGVDVHAEEKQYLVLAAVDSLGIKEFKEIIITSEMIKNPNTSASLSGTLITPPVSEADIRAGGKTIVITLDDGKWASDIATDHRNDLYDKLTLIGTTELNQWTNVITELKDAGQSTTVKPAGITRTSDTVVTITLPKVPEYEITKNQTITLTSILGACLVGGKDVTVGQKITIGSLSTATISTATYTAAEIRAGNKTIIIELKGGATWATNVATNTTVKNELLNGLKAEVDAGNQWANLIAKGTVARTSSTAVKITLPAAPDYDISTAQTISFTVPTSAAIGTTFPIETSGTVTITPVAAAPPPATKVTKVYGPTGTYKPGDIIPISVQFEDVVVVVAGVTPYITLKTGTSTRNINYTSGSGTNTLVYNYTVLAGDYSTNLTYSSTSLAPINSIKNKSTGSSVTLTLPATTASNSLSAYDIVIDAVAPKFTTTPTQNTATKAETSGDVLFKINETGKVYYVAMVDTGSTTVPTVQQIVDWNTSPIALVISHGTVNADANVAGTINIVGLSPNTMYMVYMVAEDTLQNRVATVTKCSVQTIDKTPPEFTVTNVTPSDYSISVVVNTNELGNIYAVARLRGAAAPKNTDVTSSNIKVVVDSTNVNKDIIINVTGLTVSTEYDIYVVCNDKASTTPNVSAAKIVQAKTLPLDLTKVDVDLAKNLLLNTNALMDYSLDGDKWTQCGSPTTNVTFGYTDNTDFINVYIKETLNPANPPQTIIRGRENESIITTSKIDYDIAKRIIYNNSDINLQYKITEAGIWNSLPANGQAKAVEFLPDVLLFLRTAVTSPTAAGKDSKLPSKAIELDGIPDKGEAPTLTANDTANKIDGLQSIHQYSVNGGSWISGELAAGRPNDCLGTKTVLVRFKATAYQFESEEQELQFTANTLKVTAAPATSTSKATVTIVFEENTNKAGQTLTPQQIKDWFLVESAVGVQHLWGNLQDGKFNSTGNQLTITFTSMADSTIEIGDTVTVTGVAIQNTNNPPVTFTSTGKLAGTVPKMLSIKAQNTNGDNVFSNGEQLVITFDQKTKQQNAITATNIANYLILTDVAGKKKNWSAGTPKVTLKWTTDNRVLTITFNDVSDTNLAVGDKIRLDVAWGLTDASGTSAASTSTQFITGSFTTP